MHSPDSAVSPSQMMEEDTDRFSQAELEAIQEIEKLAIIKDVEDRIQGLVLTEILAKAGVKKGDLDGEMEVILNLGTQAMIKAREILHSDKSAVHEHLLQFALENYEYFHDHFKPIRTQNNKTKEKGISVIAKDGDEGRELASLFTLPEDSDTEIEEKKAAVLSIAEEALLAIAAAQGYATVEELVSKITPKSKNPLAN